MQPGVVHLNGRHGQHARERSGGYSEHQPGEVLVLGDMVAHVRIYARTPGQFSDPGSPGASWPEAPRHRTAAPTACDPKLNQPPRLRVHPSKMFGGAAPVPKRASRRCFPPSSRAAAYLAFFLAGPGVPRLLHGCSAVAGFACPLALCTVAVVTRRLAGELSATRCV